MKQKINLFALAVLAFSMLVSCLENDIPYPIIEAGITALEADGMVGTARINANAHTVQIVVNDSVDLRAVRLTRLSYPEGALLRMADSVYANKEKFPQRPFSDLNQLPMSANTCIDLSHPLSLTLSTYQDYTWTISATQQVERQIVLDGQMGEAIVDALNRNVVIYVAKGTPLSRIQVREFNLGGARGVVVPNPADQSLYPDGFDFRQPVAFEVRHGWEETFSTWLVYVYHGDESVVPTKPSAFARTVSATIRCSALVGSSLPVLEYRPQDSEIWMKAEPSAFQVSGASCEVNLQGLLPATTYLYRILNGDKETGSGTFTTTPALALENGSLDQWHADGKLWNPWQQGAESFWDTGNKGATTISESNSMPTDDTWNGQGRAALLESKYLVLKFAAGNLFTGSYVATDGTNGILDFGRPFTAFPTALRFRYKYRSSLVNRIGDTDLQWLKGQPDSCSVYIVLADWDKPFTIKTRKSERSLLDPAGDDHILAYSVMETSTSNDTYQEVTLPIRYKVTDRSPKYIVVVASASKYGDYFTGGDASRMWIDDFELLYE